MLANHLTRKPRRKASSWLSLCGLGLMVLTFNLNTLAQQIYKTKDADGNIVFTDTPPKSADTENVQLRQSSAYSPPQTDQTKTNDETQSTEQDIERSLEPQLADEATSVAYASVQITSPGNDEALRINSGDVPISIVLQPTLQPNHVVQFYMDGQLIQTVAATSTVFPHVDRGTHSIYVVVLDENGIEQITSPSHTFHLLRHSVRR